MTMMYWVKYNHIGANYQLSGTHDGQSHRFYLGLKKSDLTGGVGSDIDYGVRAGLNTEQWANVALSYNPTARQFKIYVNGELNNTESYVNFSGASLYPLLFGANNGALGPIDFQDALIDDVQVWNRALSKNEIRSYMVTPPEYGESGLVAYYDFSRSQGAWIENIATGLFDGKVSGAGVLLADDSAEDSDGDGLIDREELALCTDGDVADTDGDGLTDGEEFGVNADGQLISYACVADSDRDGIPDGQEAALGSELLVADATGDADGDGISNREAYLTLLNDKLILSGTNIEESDRVLDVSGAEGYLETLIYPQSDQPMTMMYWVKYNHIGANYQLSGTHDGQSHRFYLGLKKSDLTGGVGSDIDYGVRAGLNTEQ
ncbi:LamG-like jellyroll fold domain-containing protein [Salinivibrio sp. ML290]|uniref:LamG-like jellyroll fold domain-containing protein n=1 Tax=Salinivibrio sp. ML290 TaxID=1909468 RepID=UPI003083847C